MTTSKGGRHTYRGSQEVLQEYVDTYQIFSSSGGPNILEFNNSDPNQPSDQISMNIITSMVIHPDDLQSVPEPITDAMVDNAMDKK
ncbi:hypothetical protein [Deinococcus deserti]|uniref:hypothetical protein n=1 Tax=Deinococcus deserti TaxID=310783 RepID=UPI0013923FD4|nr:hypothetical protein [Deinococcus deserti]